MKSALTLVLVAACFGCGGNPLPGNESAATQSDKLVSVAQVTRAFEASGLRRVTGIVARFENGPLATEGGLKTQFWSTHPAAFASPPVTVEVFASLRLARLAVAVGGNIENDKGEPIAPLPKVANVVVTMSPKASQAERLDALHALASLRKNQ